MMFPLTFDMLVYLEQISIVERAAHRKIFEENQIRLFRNLVLKLGVLSYINNKPEQLLIYDSFNNVYVQGIYLKDHVKFYLYLSQEADNSKVYINVRQKTYNDFYAPKHKKVFAKIYVEGVSYTEMVDLNRYNIPKDFLSAEKLPMYLSHPILGVYAKEKLSGVL